MIPIFSQPEIRKYKAYVYSKAFLFYIMCTFIVFAGPAFIVYRTHGLWIIEATYIEQPNVNFKYQAILHLQTNYRQLFWSTFTNLNSLQQETILSPLLRVREVDSNMDSKHDWFELQMEIPLSDDEDVFSVKLLLLFDYWLVAHSTFGMECMAIIDYTSSLPGSTLYVTADLNLKQRQLLGYKGTDTRFSLPIIDAESLQPADYRLSTIVSNYQQRNVSAALENSLYLWEERRPAGQPFRINATVWYTSPVVAYKPGLWYAMKWAWIQYVAVMLPFYFVVDKVKRFVLEHHIISCVVQRPLLDCRLRR